MSDLSKKVGIVVEAQDLASGKLSKVKSEVAGIGQAGRMAGGPFGALAGHANRAGAALGTLKGRVTGLAGSIGPLLGVGGLLGVTALLSKSISEANAFGANVTIVARTTGLAAGAASAMVDTLDKWGVSSDRLLPLLGKLEKNLGGIAEKKDGLVDFGKQFGFSLTDNHGKILDANALLLKSADYWNGHASASQKALVMSKLWGKQWQDMVPILSKGSAFIKAQEADSIHLTDTQLANMQKFRDAQRDFQDTLGDVEVKVGSELMPLLTSGMVAVSGWLDAHGDEVARFFHDAAAMAGQAASGIISVFGAIQAGWNTIPEPLRNALIGGFVANKTIKFLFGFDAAGALLGGVQKAITGAVAGGMAKGAIAAGLGKLFVQPVFVTNPGFGVGGALPGVAGAAGGLGLLGSLVVGGMLLVSIGGIAKQVADAMSFHDERQGLVNDHGLTNAQALALQLEQRGGLDALQLRDRQYAGQQFAHEATTYAQALAEAHAILDGEVARTGADNFARFNAQTALAAAGVHNLAGATGAAAAVLGSTAWLSKLQASWQKAGATMHEKIAGALADLLAGRNVHTAAGYLGSHLGRGGFGAGGYDQAMAAIAALKGLGSKDPAVAAAITKLTAELPRLKTDKDDLAAAIKIASSDAPKAKQLDDLHAIMADLRTNGDGTTRAKVQGIIDEVSRTKTAVQNLPGQIAAALPPPVRIYSTTTVASNDARHSGTTTTTTTSSSGTAAANDTRHARGLFGMARGATDIGIAGEAGDEAVAIVRNPRPFGLQNAMGHANEHALDRLAANLERLASRPVYAYASVRDVVATQHRRGSSRARQLGW